MDIETLKEWWDFISPGLPYLATIFLSYKFMDSVVKPVLKSKRDPASKQYTSKTWWWIRRFQWAYPGVFGALCGLGFNTSQMSEGNIFWFAMCGAAAQWLVDTGRDWAKSKGYNVPSLRDSITSPPPAE
jgi:hypothetical protein